MITTADEYFHERSADPHWNESGWFAFNVADRAISGWVYAYHRPNMGYTVGGVAIWDPTGEYTWDCLFHDWHDTMALDASHNMFDFKAENSLSMRCIEPLKRHRLGYDAEGCTLDLEWTAIWEPHDSGLSSISKDWGSGHFEQGGRIKGTITLESLGGETLEIDCYSNRDHSWGPRKVTPAVPRGDFPWAIASGDHAFHCTVRGDLPADQDPIDGTTERIISGWYVRDGLVGELTSGTRRCVERGADGRPLTVVLEATDSLGRAFGAEGHCVNWLNWPGYPHYYQWWSMAEWAFDGVRAFGEVSDWYPSHLSRRWMRTRRNLTTAAAR
jgi:hypothetical protein